MIQKRDKLETGIKGNYQDHIQKKIWSIIYDQSNLIYNLRISQTSYKYWLI